ncbi:MAG: hypothetical protein HY924_02255 [Elusimicrobia bacterium]|nr:hypothetical protein [Elusimicrobiota bacterium]
MTKAVVSRKKASDALLRLPYEDGLRLALNAVPDLGFQGFKPETGSGYLERHDRAGRGPGQVAKTVALGPAKDGKGDWLDGYASALAALAHGVDLPKAKPKPAVAAVVGHLMSRNEGDGLGDAAELRRIFSALGFKKTSLWLSGGALATLEEAGEASVVVSLPHGREAGRILAERLKVRLIEAELPFGLARTRRFIETAAGALGKDAEAAAFIKSELDDVIPRLEWSVPHAFLNRRFAFAGDPHYGAAFAELIAELGGSLEGSMLSAGRHHLAAEERALLEKTGQAHFVPAASTVRAEWDADFWKRVDLLVADTLLLDTVKPATGWLEFGVPSCLTHYLLEEPSLGFQGCLAFLSKAATETAKGFCLKVGAA